MPFGWDEIKNQQHEPKSRHAINKMLFERPRQLAIAATLHKVHEPLQHYLHTLFYLIDHDEEMTLHAQEQLRIAVPWQFAPGFVSIWEGFLQYPLDVAMSTSNTTSSSQTPSPSHASTSSPGAKLIPAVCAELLMKNIYIRPKREEEVLWIDEIWSSYLAKKLDMPLSGHGTFGPKRQVILTSADASLKSGLQTISDRFFQSLQNVNCLADVVIFCDTSLAHDLSGAVKKWIVPRQLLAKKGGGPVLSINGNIYIFPVNKTLQARSPLHWRYNVWSSFIHRFMVKYSHSMHVYDIRTIFQRNPFRSIELRNGLALFGYRLFTEKEYFSDSFLDEKMGHCWVDQFSPEKSVIVPDPNSPGSPGDPPFVPPVKRGYKRIVFPKQFWTAAPIVAGVAIGTVDAHANLFVQVVNGMARENNPSKCSLDQYINRMTWNMDLGMSYPLIVYNPDNGPVKSLPLGDGFDSTDNIILNRAGLPFSIVTVVPSVDKW